MGCLGACTSTHSPGTIGIQREVTERLAETLATSYVDAQVGATMAEHLRARLQAGAYDEIPLNQDLADTLHREVRAIVDDRHLGVRFDSAIVSEAPSPAPSGPAPQPSAEMLEAMRRDCAKIVTPAIVEDNIGHLKVDGFFLPEACTEVYTAAFQLLRDTRALIIDLRENRGGASTGVAFLLSFVTDGPPRLVNTIEFRSGAREETRTRDVGTVTYGAHRPVFVLTSQNTISAGEEFAYDIQAMQRAVVVGERTSGAANPGGPARLGHGFEVFVPVGRAVNAITGSNWEGVGVQPDVPVIASDALTKAIALAAGS